MNGSAELTPEVFPHLLEIQTRWNDNDVYGHVNNVVYYAYFDTVINRFLIEQGGLDIERSPVIAVCVDSQCSYKHSIAFPDLLHAGLRVEKLGNSSVRYAIGIFALAPRHHVVGGRVSNALRDGLPRTGAGCVRRRNGRCSRTCWDRSWRGRRYRCRAAPCRSG